MMKKEAWIGIFAGVLTFGGIVLALSKKKTLPPLDKADITVSDLQISPNQAGPGDIIKVSCNLANMGAASGSYTIVLGGDVMANSQTVNVPAGQSVTVTFQLPAPTAPGTYNINLGGLSGQLQVLPPQEADIVSSNLVINPNSVEPGDTVNVSIVLTNQGNAAGSATVTLSLG